MSSIIVKHCKSPKIENVEFSVDHKLHPKLDKFELMSTLNKSNFTLVLGKPGSGKTSLVTGMLKTKSLLKKVYNHIYLFCPKNSRESIKGSFWDKKLPEDQIIDNLNFDSLNTVLDSVKEYASEKESTLLILDDVQSNLKNKDVQRLFLNMVANRRHLRLSIFLLCQNYSSIPKQVRLNLTNLFVFKVSKPQLITIFDEQLECMKENFDEIMRSVYDDPHDFLFIDTLSQRLFYNFNLELIMNEE
jgi:DNA replication protein DnaC